MQPRRHYVAAILLLLASNLAVEARSAPRTTQFPPSLQGAWQIQQGGDWRLHIQSDRIIEIKDGKLTIRGLIRQQGHQLDLRNNGLKEQWTATVSKGLLILKSIRKDKLTGGTFHRLEHVPPDLKLEALPVARPTKLPPETVQNIQSEVKNKFEAEQVLLKDRQPSRDRIAAMQRDNLAYLTDLLKTVGWTDTARFGAKTSVDVVIMAKHTHDLRLMMTLLPYAKQDLKNSGDGQTYAVLYDALQLQLGKKQLYGTQVAKDETDGHFFVLPLQDSRDAVNRRLVKMGLPKLEDYLAVFSQTFGQPVQCCRQDG